MTVPRPTSRDLRPRSWHVYSLPLVLGLLPLQVYVLLPHGAYLKLYMSAPPAFVFSVWLISGLLAVNQPWPVRWEFRILLSVKMRWMPLPLLASFVSAPFLSRNPSLQTAYGAFAERAWVIILASWILAYGAGVATRLPTQLPGTMRPVPVRLLLVSMLLPMPVWLLIAEQILRHFIH